ncbi:hypothetical protein N665_0082s0030 [Sinapis alba]|nr:hypothetical protein N665_0082s0030 [Sinapis alba]
MQRWGQGLLCVCVFYGEPDETRDHLFFVCPYTYTLWIDVVGTLMCTQPDPDWCITMEHLAHRSHDKLTIILFRLAFQVTVYHIWGEMNERRHNNVLRSNHLLARIVEKTIRNSIMSIIYYEKSKLRSFLQRWFFKDGSPRN